jgi:hypothetical protein
MSRRRQSALLTLALFAALSGGPLASTARAQCARGGSPGSLASPGGSRQQLQQLQLLQQLQQQQQLQQLQLLQQQRQARADLERQVRELLDQGPEAIRTALQDPNPEMRFVAARAAGRSDPSLATDLIERVTDENSLVRQAVRNSLVRLSTAVKDAGGKPVAQRRIDFGPTQQANRAAQKIAADKWRTWFTQALAKADAKPVASPAPTSLPFLARSRTSGQKQ